MKNLIFASILFCTPAVALEVRYIDPVATFEGTDTGKAAMANIRADYDAKKKEVSGRILKFQARIDEIKKLLTKKDITDEERASLYTEAETESKDIEALSEKYWKEFTDLKDAALKEFQPKFGEIIVELTKKMKIDLVLDKNSLIYFSKNLDLTDTVIKEYNKKYPLKKD